MSKTIEEINEVLLLRLLELLPLAKDGYKYLENLNYYEEGLKEARGKIGMAHRLIEYIGNHDDYVKSQTHELTAWKESASKVFKNLDLQAIGKTLGIGLGEDVSTNVLPKIKELQEQNAELVFVLHNIANMLEVDAKISVESIRRVLTKYNHLKSNTNA